MISARIFEHALHVLLSLLCLCSITNQVRAQTQRKGSKSARIGPSKIVDIQSINVTSNLLEWDKDLAVMFYAPWCKYCKQLVPSWEAIAGLVEDNVDLAITRLNCEGEKENVKLCRSLNIDRYPTIIFFGYGNFNQAPKSSVFGKQPHQQMVQYVADLYPEAIYDWILFLSSISSMRRRWDDFVSIFTGNSRLQRRLQALEARVRDSEKKSQLFSKELERYKAYELFDSLDDLGDVFPLLHDLEPDENNLPLRVCVGDMATEFCQYNKLDQYCSIIDQCVEQDLEPEVCRPKSCPFDDKRGCKVVSTCMKSDVINQYKKSLKLS